MALPTTSQTIPPRVPPATIMTVGPTVVSMESSANFNYFVAIGNSAWSTDAPISLTASPTAPKADRTGTPTADPTVSPTADHTASPTAAPTESPIAHMTALPTAHPTAVPAVFLQQSVRLSQQMLQCRQ